MPDTTLFAGINTDDSIYPSPEVIIQGGRMMWFRENISWWKVRNILSWSQFSVTEVIAAIRDNPERVLFREEELTSDWKWLMEWELSRGLTKRVQYPLIVLWGRCRTDSEKAELIWLYEPYFTAQIQWQIQKVREMNIVSYIEENLPIDNSNNWMGMSGYNNQISTTLGNFHIRISTIDNLIAKLQELCPEAKQKDLISAFLKEIEIVIEAFTTRYRLFIDKCKWDRKNSFEVNPSSAGEVGKKWINNDIGSPLGSIRYTLDFISTLTSCDLYQDTSVENDARQYFEVMELVERLHINTWLADQNNRMLIWWYAAFIEAECEWNLELANQKTREMTRMRSAPRDRTGERDAYTSFTTSFKTRLDYLPKNPTWSAITERLGKYFDYRIQLEAVLAFLDNLDISQYSHSMKPTDTSKINLGKMVRKLRKVSLLAWVPIKAIQDFIFKRYIRTRDIWEANALNEIVTENLQSE